MAGIRRSAGAVSVHGPPPRCVPSRSSDTRPHLGIPHAAGPAECVGVFEIFFEIFSVELPKDSPFQSAAPPPA